MRNSVRLFEREHEKNLTTRIAKVVEQPIKIARDGKSSMLNTLGIVLAETIFHPQGGGQPADKGMINGVPVLAVNSDKDIIYHYLDPRQLRNKRFVIDQQVTLSLDETFRMQCQRSHTAGHLITDIVELDPLFEIYQAKVLKGHHFPGSEYIKILVNFIPADEQLIIQQINQCLTKLIQANLPITINYHADGLRYIKIAESARMCHGTHVKTTYGIENCRITQIKTAPLANGQVELTIFYEC